MEGAGAEGIVAQFASVVRAVAVRYPSVSSVGTGVPGAYDPAS